MDFYAAIRRNRAKSILLLVVFFALLGVVISGLGYYFTGSLEPPTLITSVSIGAILVTTLYLTSSRIALALNHAQEVSYEQAPALHNLVEEMSLAAGIPKPRVYIVNDSALNAFATGRKSSEGHVAFTTGLLQSLNRDQLQGVVAHEISHIKNEDIKLMTVVAAVATALVLVSDFGLRLAFFGGGNRNNNNSSPAAPIALLALVAAIVLAPIASAIIQASISRKRESLADVSAVEMTRNPLGLRDALLVLQAGGTSLRAQHNSTAHMWIGDPGRKRRDGNKPFISRLFSTHPPLEERIEVLNRLSGER